MNTAGFIAEASSAIQRGTSTLLCKKTFSFPRSDFQGKRMNPPYRPYTQGYPSKVVFRHTTQLFRGCYSHDTWKFIFLNFDVVLLFLFGISLTVTETN